MKLIFVTLQLTIFMMIFAVNFGGISPSVIRQASTWQKRNFKSTLIAKIINGVDSPAMPFYARVMFLEDNNPTGLFCGATIIGSYWVMTAAKCVAHITMNKPRKYESLAVQITQNHKIWKPARRVYKVDSIFIAPNHNYESNREDIALLRLTQSSIYMSQYRIIPLCTEPENHGTVLGTCGMGSTSRQRLALPEGLKATTLKESKFRSQEIFELHSCPEDQICAFPELHGSDTNICYMDEGSPLYTLNCYTGLPQCVLGVASYYDVYFGKTAQKSCKGGSYFASVPYLIDWIRTAMDVNS